MAAEFKDKGAHVILGPVAGPLGRSGYGGRNWEGFSPDPYLTGEMFQTVATLYDGFEMLLTCPDYRRNPGDGVAGLC